MVTVEGEIDLQTAERLQRELSSLREAGAVSLIVDLRGVEFCDSTGVNVLLADLRRARERGGALVLVEPRSVVLRVLRVTGLDSVFPVCDTVDDAIRQVAAGRH